MADKPRGSELLKRRYTDEDLTALVEAAQAVEGVDLVEFFPLGIPGPDGGWGVWHVGRERISDLIAALIAQRHVPHFEVFPKGIPVVDAFEVRFRAGSQQAH